MPGKPTTRPRHLRPLELNSLPKPVVRRDAQLSQRVLAATDYHHPHFWFPNATLVLALPGAFFRIHASQLARRSEIFKSWLAPVISLNRRSGHYSSDSAASSEEGELVDVMKLDDDPLDWSCLLAIMFLAGGESVENPTMQELVAVLKLSDKYAMQGMKNWAMARLRAGYFPSPSALNNESLSAAPLIVNLAKNIELTPEVHSLALYSLRLSNPNPDTLDPTIALQLTVGRQRMADAYFEFLKMALQDLWTYSQSHACQVPGKEELHVPEECLLARVTWFQHASALSVQDDPLMFLRSIPSMLPAAGCLSCLHRATELCAIMIRMMENALPDYMDLPSLSERLWEYESDPCLRKGFRP